MTDVKSLLVARELQHGGTVAKLRKELIQVAAVAMAWVERLNQENG